MGSALRFLTGNPYPGRAVSCEGRRALGARLWRNNKTIAYDNGFPTVQIERLESILYFYYKVES